MIPQTYSFLIVEDELLISEMIAQILNEAGYHHIRQTDSVEGAVEAIRLKAPDLVLTDIALGRDKTGIDLGQLLHSIYHIPFIYISSHSSPEILGKAKHTRPNAYIVKPFKPEDLLVSIEFALFNSGQPKGQVKDDEELTVKEGRTIVKLSYSEIVMLEAEGNYTSITMSNNRRRMIRTPISEFESQLEGQSFIRVHKSYIVNQAYVKEARTTVLLVNGQEVPVGRTYQAAVISRFHLK